MINGRMVTTTPNRKIDIPLEAMVLTASKPDCRPTTATREGDCRVEVLAESVTKSIQMDGYFLRAEPFGLHLYFSLRG